MSKKKPRKTGSKKPKSEVEELLPELSQRQLQFITHYLSNGGNATQAAKSAGYSETSAYNQGARMMKNDVIKGIIAAHRKEMEHKFNISRESLIQELASLAYFNMKDVMNEGTVGVSLKSWDLIPDHVAKAIQSVNESDGGNGGFSQSVRGPAKQPAIESLWKKMGYKNEEAGTEPDASGDVDAALTERLQGFLSKRK